jgi:hypothetical protein
MDDLDQEIYELIREKIRLDAKYKVPDSQMYARSYIDAHPEDVQGVVYRLLNIYDFVCLGAKVQLLSKEIVEDMRGDALRETWKQYGDYIRQRRTVPAGLNAWKQCDNWGEQVPPTGARPFKKS